MGQSWRVFVSHNWSMALSKIRNNEFESPFHPRSNFHGAVCAEFVWCNRWLVRLGTPALHTRFCSAAFLGMRQNKREELKK